MQAKDGHSYVILNIDRGCADGHYFYRNDAEDMLELWRERFPGESIEMIEVVGKFVPITGHYKRRYWMAEHWSQHWRKMQAAKNA